MKIIFWGTRGSIAAPGKNTCIYGGNTTCVQIVLENGRTLIIDAGTGIRELGEYLAKGEMQKELTILLTHSHWDHIQGFPFFLPVYNPEQHITIKGFSSSCTILKDIFTQQMITSYFPINFSDLKSKIEFIELSFGTDNIYGLQIEVIQNVHPGGSIGLKIKEQDKIFTFITDCELSPVLENPTMHNDLISYCKNSDLLAIDAQYLPSELEKYGGWGHSTYEQVGQLAKEADVGRILMIHHDPRRDDKGMLAMEVLAKQYLKKLGCHTQIEAAKEKRIYKP